LHEFVIVIKFILDYIFPYGKLFDTSPDNFPITYKAVLDESFTLPGNKMEMLVGREEKGIMNSKLHV
jgi:hypothetical protein